MLFYHFIIAFSIVSHCTQFSVLCYRKVMSSREQVAEQLAHYLQLKTLIEQLQTNNMTGEPLRTQVDIGCNFYMQAKV